MSFTSPSQPLYDAATWRAASFEQRARLICQTWAMQGYGTPGVIFLAYALKVALYVGAWVAFCSATPALGGAGAISTWWLAPLAFQKAIVWSMLFEVLGLGCGSGPLTGRYVPPVGGFLYFLRPGTLKLPLFPGTALIGRPQRGALDALAYAALIVCALRALLAPELGASELLPLVVLLPLLGVLDKTVFLAARAEHYWVMISCFVFAPAWLASAKAIQLALWFWAGFSKLNHHFPTVVCTMTSNSPYLRLPGVLRRMYRAYPDDLRPSRLAEGIAHAGTLLELAVPLAFLLTPHGTQPVIAIGLMLMLHSYITSNIPMGVPLEWNVLVVYSGFALFWAHPDVSLHAIAPLPVLLFLLTTLVALPLLGNLFPSRLSFLLSMRYYAGNWPVSVWLFRDQAYDKLAKLRGSTPWIGVQLAGMYDASVVETLLARVMAFRMMHLAGRAFPMLLPRALGGADALERYQWVDGEVIAGMALGWNFGDGHLHQEQLLAAVQAQCNFEPGELRCMFLEAQPLGRDTMSYRICDASTGQIEADDVQVSELRERQPWAVG